MLVSSVHLFYLGDFIRMPLKLKVIRYKGHPPVERLEAFFGQGGGTLGRSSETRENHLTLPDPEQFISRRHASISFENGLYYLTDTSVDGTHIQNRNIRVYRDTVVLADGDRLRIGDYELSVHISSDDAPEPAVPASVFSTGGGAPVVGLGRDAKVPKTPSGDQAGYEKDSLWWQGSDVFEEGPQWHDTARQPEGSPLHESFTPPDVAGEPIQPQGIPENFNFEELISDLEEPYGDSAVSEPSAARRQDIAIQRETPGGIFEAPLFTGKAGGPDGQRPLQKNAAPSPAKSPGTPIPPDSPTIEKIRQQAYFELIQAFLGAAGIKDTRFLQNRDMPEIMQALGAVFREMVAGLMAILRGRSELKNQLRVSATILRPVDNNPLKFSRIVDEALTQLLTKDQPGFLDAIPAVREGFADIMDHQLAMTAGIQAAAIKLLERFDPQNFTKQHDEGVVFQRKAKSWDAYRQSYAEIANQALEDFFGETFARAYEEQIDKLRSKTNANQSGRGKADANE